MILVGELSDKRLHDQMMSDLQAMNLSVSSTFHREHHVFSISVENPDDLAPAQDYFRVKLGFQKPQQIDEEWVKIKSLPRGQMTFYIVIACVGIYLLSFSSLGRALYDALFMGSVETGFLYEIKRGQIWRLWTPMFLHLSLMHILFNMLWFRDLGYLIEHRFGQNDLLKIMVISGLISNLLQYAVAGPSFGGMSGVLYAMLGYIWIYKKIDPNFDFSLPKRDITLMIGWLFLCMTGLLGPIANTAHAGGLFSGMLYALYRGHNDQLKWGKTQLKYFILAVLFLAFTIAVEGLKLKGRYFILLWNEG